MHFLRAKKWRLLGVSLLLLGATGIVMGQTLIRLVPAPLIHEIIPEGILGDSIERALEPQFSRVPVQNPIAAKIVAAAHTQIGDFYDASYQRISYPNGDVPKGQGACTDVIVRALRGAGYDLQKLIHNDIRDNNQHYPKSWGLKRADKNIDHRRVPNHMVFFERFGKSLPLGLSQQERQTFLPGDIVCWKMEGGKWHTGIVSDGVSERGYPLTIHNGWRCVEEDNLDRWEIVGHYRFPVPKRS